MPVLYFWSISRNCSLNLFNLNYICKPAFIFQTYSFLRMELELNKNKYPSLGNHRFMFALTWVKFKITSIIISCLQVNLSIHWLETNVFYVKKKCDILIWFTLMIKQQCTRSLPAYRGNMAYKSHLVFPQLSTAYTVYLTWYGSTRWHLLAIVIVDSAKAWVECILLHWFYVLYTTSPIQ